MNDGGAFQLLSILHPSKLFLAGWRNRHLNQAFSFVLV